LVWPGGEAEAAARALLVESVHPHYDSAVTALARWCVRRAARHAMPASNFTLQRTARSQCSRVGR
jgi:hypothetical protein